MAIRTIDDSILQGIAEDIQAKDGGGKMYDTEMRSRIEAILAQDNTTLNSLIGRSITSIENDEVTIIGVGAFQSCTLLTRVSFPRATLIGNGAFRYCPNLTCVILGARASLISSNSFSGADNAIIYVKPEDLSWYSTATNWSTLYAQDRIKSIEDLTGDDLVWYQEQLARYQAA